MDKEEITSLDWVRKAADHEKNARSLLEHKDGVAWGPAFFSQQMAELFLKGLLLAHDLELVKTHDLLELSKLLIDFEPELKDLKDDLKQLNEYYLEDRYPGDYPELTWNEAESAFESALRIKEFVLSKITLSLSG